MTAFVLAHISEDAKNGEFGLVSLTANAKTGTGAPKTVVARAGANGGDGVFGTSRGQQFDTGRYDVAAAPVALTKTQAVSTQSEAVWRFRARRSPAPLRRP